MRATISLTEGFPTAFLDTGMDSTHTQPIWRSDLEAYGFDVEYETFYGGVFSGGLPDSLFATWRNK